MFTWFGSVLSEVDLVAFLLLIAWALGCASLVFDHRKSERKSQELISQCSHIFASNREKLVENKVKIPID